MDNHTYLEGCDVLIGFEEARDDDDEDLIDEIEDIVGSDWYYSLTELQKLMGDLKVDLTALLKDLAAPGAVDRFGYSNAEEVKSFVGEVTAYLSSSPLSAVDPTSSKTMGDALVGYRQRAANYRQRLASSGVHVSDAPPPPAQRRRDDPRDLADQAKEDAAWGWKSYTLVGVLGLGTIAGLAYVGKHWVLGR